MFTLEHFIWLFISIIFIFGFMYYLLKKKPPLTKVLTFCCIVCIASEFIKVFTQIEMIPDETGEYFFPYLSRAHLPFHLCSIQIIFIFYAKFAKESKAKDTLLAFMYPSCLLGAIMALLMPSIFSDGVGDAFTSALSYQYFGYHIMLVVLGLYLPLSKQVNIQAKNYFTSLAIILFLGFVAIYLNSMFSTVDFDISGEYGGKYYAHLVNFFFIFKNPIGLKFTELWHWYLYFIVLLFLVFSLIAICYIPYFKAYFKNKKAK